MDFDDYVQRFKSDSFTSDGKFIGVVEDNADNLQIGRVRVRVFGVHPEDRTLVPTEDLPWAIVAQPTTSASISGIGSSPNGLELGTWVLGFFADGKDCMYPIVTHSLPGIHRPNPPGVPGGSSAGYLQPGSYDTGPTSPADVPQPYHNQNVEPPVGAGLINSSALPGTAVPPSPIPSGAGVINTVKDPSLAPAPNGTAFGSGATIAQGAADVYLTLADKDRWTSLGLPTYSYTPVPDGYACKDGHDSLRFHYGTALAFEALTKDYGKGKLFLNSAYRTAAYNAQQPGAAKASQHIQGRALDVGLGSVGHDRASLIKFGQMAVKRGFTGFGIYSEWIHIDTGNGRVWLGATESWFTDAIKAAGWYPGKKGLSDVKTNPGATANPADAKAAAAADGTNASGKFQNLPPGSPGATLAATMQKAGYNDAQISAALGHAQAESSLNPNTTIIDSNGQQSIGMFQWNGPRNAAYRQYAASTGQDLYSAQTQSNYFVQTMQQGGANGPGSSQFNSATTPFDASMAMNRYEGFAGYNDPNGSNSQNRLSLTNSFYGGGSVYGGAASGATKGFVDPTNSLPFPSYRGNPSTHVNARGFNTNIDQQALTAKDTGRMTGIPAAGDQGTFGEPELASAPQYPYNHTYGTKSGHLEEFDDTPGAERINIEHRTGTGIEMFSDGSMVERVKGNHFITDFGDAYTGIMGKYFLSSVNDMHIRSTADMVQQSDGSFKLLIGNDGQITVSGDYVLSVGEDIKIRSGKRLVIEAEGIDLISSADINIEAKGGVNLKAGKGINLQAAQNVDVLAVEVHLDDVVRMAEGLAKGNAGADTADVGLPPARTVISKNNMKTTTNATKVTTTEEAASFYAAGTS